jgi:acetylornithine deacetylase/succinyl-diaminopimelate desuccinylase-like protein
MKRRALALFLVVAGALSVPAGAQMPGVDPQIATLLTRISEQRLIQLLQRLQGFHTRNTMSSTAAPTRGIGAARQWILDEMRRSSPRLQVSFDSYRIPPQGERILREVDIVNVMAVLPGRTARRIYVSGHYDSLARVEQEQGEGAAAPGGFDWAAGDNFAPGANDDGSGTALTMELARVFAESGLEFDATLVFVAFAGEEQGLVGSRLHAQRAAAEKLTIDAVFNNDIVGNISGGQGVVDSERVRVFSEGPEDSASRQIARFVRRHAARYIPAHEVRPIARQDRFGRGSDHQSFNQLGFPAVRFTEANENYARQHSVRDTFDGVSAEYLARNAQVNATAVAVMALAPAAPRVTGDRGQPTLDRGTSGYDARLRWTASPGAAGYRIFWRDAWAPDWQHELQVGNVTEHVLPNLSIDDYVFGVAAVGPGGHESVVAAYVNPPRPSVDIKTTTGQP